jgi:hypothetical protein
MEKKKMKPMAILKTFFGYLPGTGLKEFGVEMKALTSEDKKELVTLAAVELDLEVEES